MTTIKQIASLAGVSRGTVDRVLNNRGGVNEETARKVREIAAMANYVPNKIGKTLAVKKRNIKLGVLLLNSKSNNQFIDDLALGAKKQSHELVDYGVTVEFEETQIGHPEQQLACINRLVELGVSGIAIMPEQHPMIQQRLRQLTEEGMAVVTVNTDIEGTGRLAYVGSNNLHDGETAAGLMALMTGGATKLCIVTGSIDMLCHAERIQGFRQQMEQHYPGLEILEIVENHDDDFESFERTKELIDKWPQMETLYIIAAGVFGACRAVEDKGLAGKLKILCFDFSPAPQAMLKNRVVSAVVSQQPLKQGAQALTVLFEYLAMGTPPKTLNIYTDNVIKIAESLS